MLYHSCGIRGDLAFVQSYVTTLKTRDLAFGTDKSDPPQVLQGRLDSLAVATIKALTTVMHKSPAAKVTWS